MIAALAYHAIMLLLVLAIGVALAPPILTACDRFADWMGWP